MAHVSKARRGIRLKYSLHGRRKTPVEHNGHARKSVLLAGSALVCLLIACDDPTVPTVVVDGVLAYSESGVIHVLELSDFTDRIIHTAEAGTDIRSLTWAPDGLSLVFHTFAFGQHTQFLREWKMYRVSDDGSGVSLMYDRGGPETFPAYGPDGRLAYWGGSGLYIDGSLVYPTAVEEDESAPSWSPDGGHIAFTSGRDLVYLSLSDTSDAVSVLENSEHQYHYHVREPAISPDGSRIAFVREVSSGESEIWLADIDGSDEIALTRGNLDRHPSWSGDGTLIAFARNRIAIYTIEADSGSRAQLLLRHPVEHIAWAQ